MIMMDHLALDDSFSATSSRRVSTIAAVIVTWHTEEMTMELLRYLVASFPHLDLIVVECGPETHQLDAALSRVTVMRAGNLGYAGGNNLGIHEALRRDTDWILALNSDAFPLAGSLGALVAALEAHPDAGAAGATLISLHPDGGIELNQGTCFDWRTGRTRLAPHMTDPTPVEFCCGAMLLFRSATLRLVGGFDSTLFLFHEEIDWAERARAAGHSILAVPAARALHLGSRSVRQAPKATTYYQARNRLIILRRHGPSHGIQVSLVREGGVLLRAVVGHIARGRWSRVWPLVRGTLDGAISPTNWSDDPVAAIQRQRWEARDDSSEPVSGRSARTFLP
jgi:GT2 family glycosyltransferase